jgi:hypothetical protein
MGAIRAYRASGAQVRAATLLVMRAPLASTGHEQFVEARVDVGKYPT